MNKKELDLDPLEVPASQNVTQNISYTHNVDITDRKAELTETLDNLTLGINHPPDEIFFITDAETPYLLMPIMSDHIPLNFKIKKIFGWCWADNIFGPIVTLTFYFHNFLTPYCRLYFRPRSREIELLKNTPNLDIILYDKNCNYTKTTVCRISLISYFTSYLNKHIEESLIEAKGAYACYYLAASKFLAHINCNPEKIFRNKGKYLLGKSYIKRYESEFNSIASYYRECGDIIEKCSNLKNYVEEIEKDIPEETLRNAEPWPWPTILLGHFIKEIVGSKVDPIAYLMKLHDLVDAGDGSDLTELEKTNLYYNLVNIFHCALYNPESTSWGHLMLSQNIDNEYYYEIIDYEVLGKNVEKFWDNIPWLLMPFFRETIGKGDIPISREYYNKVPMWEGEIDEAEERTNTLLSEAYFLKQNTIPYGAYHPLDGALNFKAIKMFEIGDEVVALLISASSEFLMVTCCPKIQKFFVRIDPHVASWDPDSDVSKGSERMNRFIAGISFLLAHLIRDFWVVEERQSSMSSRFSNRRDFSLRSDKNKKKIVYLPRIRYVARNYDKADSLHLARRKPHFVTGHLRKAVNASDKQIAFAKKFSIHVPAGFTFVQPHSRGDAAQEVHYRSISALRCIQAIDPVKGAGKDDWFQFELNTKNWLKHHGYDVIHASANRSGDGGVDIQALKGDEHLLVQCKYWSHAKIGPDKIRELKGALHTFPAGSKGVMVTSTELTAGAKELAVEYKIQFIENINFKENFRTVIQS